MERLSILISQVPSNEASKLAEQLNIELTGVEVLKIEPLPWSYHITETSEECCVVTSKNARGACIEAYGQHSDDCVQVECVGVRTAQILIDAGLPVKHIGSRASDLLQSPEEDGYQAVRFFCGTSRRNTIKERTKQLHLPYTEQVVYKSSPTYPELPERRWDGIIFTSPLATESLLLNNPVQRSLPAMAMGETTEQVVKQFGFDQVMTPGRPAIEAILKEFNSHLRR